ncbi:MAG: hydroxyethylthiazole kinase [Candidatus Aegiribacteria sp.]|nr:hydroxyethylthiazole kinase [Candidatus Aegiribacteria sp.]
MKPAEITCQGLDSIRSSRPMIHHITNTVVMNFTANVTLCLGAAPVMAPCIKESPEMVRFAGALLLNIGTLDLGLVRSMLAAGKVANELGIPIIFDPVGAGATGLRTDSAKLIIRELEIAVIRGNAGEILALSGAEGKVRGVDSMDSVEDHIDLILSFAAESGSVIAVTGISDIVTDGNRTARIENGHSLMGRVTGTGCSASTSVACFAAAMEDPFHAALGGLVAIGIAGENAAEVCAGPGTFVPCFLDALSDLNRKIIESHIRAEIF